MPKNFEGVMHEWKEGDLHSGTKKGKVVKNQKQAEAIAFSEQKKMNGGKEDARHHLQHAADHLHQALSSIGGGDYA
jgi:hypothetical protein